MWIARDKNGELWIYKKKPKKNSAGMWDEIFNTGYMRMNPHIFPEVTWEDEEPTEVEIFRDESGYMWAARDECGDLYIYTEKPFKYESAGGWVVVNLYDFILIEIDEPDIPEELSDVSWYDSEPTEIRVKVVKH